MRLNIPPIMRQMANIIMPSIPLVSRPLAMSQMTPTTARTTKRPQTMLSSIQFALGFVDLIPMVDEVIG
jgi:hypothetical protein